MRKLITKIKQLFNTKTTTNLKLAKVATFEALEKICKENKQLLCLFRGDANPNPQLISSWVQANASKAKPQSKQVVSATNLRTSLSIFAEYLDVIQLNRQYETMSNLAILTSLYDSKDVLTPLMRFWNNIHFALRSAFSSRNSTSDVTLFVLIARSNDVHFDIDFRDPKLISKRVFTMPQEEKTKKAPQPYFVADNQDWIRQSNVLQITIPRQLALAILDSYEHQDITPVPCATRLKSTYYDLVMSDSAKQILAGSLHFRDENHKDAVKAFSKAIALNPTSIAAYIGRAGAKFKLNKSAVVPADLAKAISINSRYWLPYFIQASMLMLCKKYRKAIKYFDKALALQKTYDAIYISKGITCALLNDHDSAIANFDKALALNPASLSAHFNRGHTLFYRCGDGTRALADFTFVIKANDPDYMFQAYFNRALVFIEKEQYSKALADLNKADQMDPQSANLKCRRGFALAKLCQYDQAVENYDQALSLEPNYVEVYVLRGMAFIELTNYHKAISDFTKAIALNPNLVHAYRWRGEAHFNLNQVNEALADYDKAIAIEPGDANAYLGRGKAFATIKEFSKAFKNFDQAIRLNPHFVDAYFNKGQACLDTQRYAEAVKVYTKLTELISDNSSVYFLRARAFANLGEHDNAISDMEKVRLIENANDNY